jgi:maltose O-acetyltransferase
MLRTILKRILIKIGVIHEDYTIIESLRARGVRIGENVDIINTNIDGGFGFLCSIGNNVTLTGVTVLTHDASTKKFIGYSKIGPVTIGNDVFIGQGSIILPNVRIGNKVIVGAGTIVAKDVPDNVVIVGNPWRVIMSFDEYIDKNKESLSNSIVNVKYWQEMTEEEKTSLSLSLNKTNKYGYNV